ncbi:hypothetical protein [Blastococcus sp. VKM Ac-2987]|uniref:hypothetical protein n=1 Tax=Blastococcus sp. VKM Ac-2987 TaxID=3004141 RepID=UPI0022AB9F52|nr:hypothetical protein [Blastococcus sp. VKM Ac-2987]MCZ2857832.1 hypothetical protein [Blastococcus sp. VKM Ac-2987]
MRFEFEDWRRDQAWHLFSRARSDWQEEHGWPGGLDFVELFQQTVQLRRRALRAEGGLSPTA